MKTIGIAVVESFGKYLVGVRGPDVPLAGCAEFPGGKCLDNEAPFDCAVRECFEESGLAVVPLRLLYQCVFDYPHDQVELNFVLCQPCRAADVLDHHEGFSWVKAQDLCRLKFPAANIAVIELLFPKSVQSSANCNGTSILP